MQLPGPGHMCDRALARGCMADVIDVTRSDRQSADFDSPANGVLGPTVFLDLDTVLLAIHQGRRGVELGLQADLGDALARLSEVAHPIVVLVDPPPTAIRRGLETTKRLDVLRDGLGETVDDLIVVACPHGEERACSCAKPERGLIDLAVEQHDLPPRVGWYVGADQEGVVAGRTAGLRTIRIGPLGEDHLSAVHRPDYEARDLMDAANHILIEEFAA